MHTNSDLSVLVGDNKYMCSSKAFYDERIKEENCINKME